MDPADGGYLCEDSVTYEQACFSYGDRLPGSGRAGRRRVNSHICSRW
ncbi:MAG: hypothetical protein BWY94_00423 [Actinobacteria bacterium ADurb.BinA094]|nr:MAG: hypothetical protein BWY94_00423 [Actinobacteria bacterium ADurb.BinA094]